MNARESRDARSLRRDDWPAVGVETACPVHLDKWAAGKKFAGHTVQDVKESIAIAPEHQFARTAVPIRIRQDGNLHRVIVVGVARCELEIPLEFPGIRVEGDGRIRVQVIAGSLFRVPVRTGISGAPIGQVEIGIVGTGNPDGSAAMFPIATSPTFVAGFPWLGDRIKAPGFFSGASFEGGDKAANPELTSGDADDHFVFDHQGRHGHGVASGSLGQLHVPECMAVFGIDGNQVRVDGGHEE